MLRYYYVVPYSYRRMWWDLARGPYLPEDIARRLCNEYVKLGFSYIMVWVEYDN